MKISIATRTVTFSSLAIGSFFVWYGERFQKIAEWKDDNSDNVLCIDAKRGSRYGENDEVTPINGRFEYVNDVLTFVQTGLVKFGDIEIGNAFSIGNTLYIKRSNVSNEGVVESNAYCLNTNELNVFTPDVNVDPRTITVSAE